MTVEKLLQGLSKALPGRLDAVLTVPQLMHLKAAFEREFYDAYYDPLTPCPHNGTSWEMNGSTRCGQCGRRISAVIQKEETHAVHSEG